jgi:hypothetical protein
VRDDKVGASNRLSRDTDAKFSELSTKLDKVASALSMPPSDPQSFDYSSNHANNAVPQHFRNAGGATQHTPQQSAANQLYSLLNNPNARQAYQSALRGPSTSGQRLAQQNVRFDARSLD